MDEKNIAKIATLFAVLGSPARLQILTTLLEDPVCHMDLARCVPLDVSTIWRHAKRLESVGLVETRREGRKVVVYPKDPQRIQKLLKIAEEIVKHSEL